MDFLEELQKYFEVTPQEKVLEDWAKYDTVENNVGLTVEEFLNSTRIICQEKMLGKYACEVQCEKCKTDNTIRFTREEFRRTVNDFLVQVENGIDQKMSLETRKQAFNLYLSLNEFYLWLDKNYWKK